VTDTIPLGFWLGFNAFVLAMLALDLGVFHRKSHEIKFREALSWSAFWIALALVFNAGIYLFWDRVAPGSGYTRGEAGLAFLTGYLIEKSLSVDNLFVILLIFSYFAVPALYQHKVLFWGILGALVFRAAFIFAGVALIERFAWMVLVFGGFLILTGVKMAFEKDKKIEPDKNPVLRLFKRAVPVTPGYHGGKFFTRLDGRVWATPLFVALLFVEMTDIVFAVDSIPAILAVTREPFLVYTANVFAILGLRSLYFALAGIMKLFHHLHYGLSAILVFVGGKMLYTHFTGDKVDTALSLGVIAATLTLSIVASLRWPHAGEGNAGSAAPPPARERPANS
jgi:tellurite resistance protein TerC